jgi:phosphatidylserine/phosphatidylglycerophosphate/cardiolipin synthase-like enzyme
MNIKELKQSLRQSLDDYRLSRGEKQGLRELIKKAAGSDEHKRAVIRSEMFEIARNEMASPEAKQVTQWLEDVLKLLVPSPEDSRQKLQSEAFFSSEDSCAHKIITIISRMRRTIDICVFTITDDRIAKAILDAHKRKVKIRIVTDDEKARDLGSDIQRLSAAGIEIRMDASLHHMHHKYALFDGTYLLTGSYNWTRSADTKNKENFIVTNDPELFAEFQNHFEGMWQGYR